MFTALIVFLSVVVSGASTGLESVVVTPKEATLVETLVDDAHDTSPHTDKILKFINENSSSDKSFHVQGWRWHTHSLARDVRRLGTLCSQVAQNATINIHDKSLEKAVYHVIQFNMKALHRIEDKTFFPWLRAQLSSVVRGDLAESFSLVMDNVVEQQKQVADAGSQVVCKCW
jgi:type II secretory pathway predicted ATPase ExeA